MRKHVLSSWFLALGLLTACGGGKKEVLTPAISNVAPTAIIKVDSTDVTTGQDVFLDGSTSSDPDEDEITYAWSQIGGETVTLKNDSEAIASFVAPQTETTLVIQLVVTDASENASAPAQVQIQVHLPSPAPAGGTPTPTAPDLDYVVVSPQGLITSVADGMATAQQMGLSKVKVSEGTYRESITIPSHMELEGENARLEAPAGSSQIVLIDNAEEVTFKGFSLSGTEGAACRTITVTGSRQIHITNNRFLNRGTCTDTIALWLEQSTNLEIRENRFEFVGAGSETYLKAVQASKSDSLIFAGNVITGDGTPFSNTTVFSAFTLTDITGLEFHENSVEVAGGTESVGIALRCSEQASDILLEKNSVHLTQVAGQGAGIRITCPVENSRFLISKNRFQLSPVPGQAVVLNAIEANALRRSITMSVDNNIVAMSNVATATESDVSHKTALALSRLGSNAQITLLFNTVMLQGKEGVLSLLSSSNTDVSFSTLGNIVFLNGSNTRNALFSLKEACEASDCAKQVVANLVGRRNTRMAYYTDTGTSRDIEEINICEADPVPVECTNNEIRLGENVVTTLAERYFDTSGELLESYSNLVNGKGPTETGIATDIDDNPRGSAPDIGAQEF